MAKFDLGLAQCDARIFAECVDEDYVLYFKRNNIKIREDNKNPLVEKYMELCRINTVIDKCTNEEDISNVYFKIEQLRWAISIANKENK